MTAPWRRGKGLGCFVCDSVLGQFGAVPLASLRVFLS
jgi:hypothetical protein